MSGKVKHRVVIDKEKCIGCGLCAKDCVGFAIQVIDGAASVNGQGCIKCGHCEAICPQGAVTITGYKDVVEEYDEQVRLDPQELLAAIKTRRTIRNFTEDAIAHEVVEMIMEAGRLAPTGANSQGTSYIILDRKKAECEAQAVGLFRKLLNIGSKVIKPLRSMSLDDNFFFKKAPLVIVILGKDKVSASLAAQNMAFMAEANGLGVLFSGFFTTCFNMSRKIRKIIGVPKKPKAITTIVIGYPAVKYHRTAHRNAAKITRA